VEYDWIGGGYTADGGTDVYDQLLRRDNDAGEGVGQGDSTLIQDGRRIKLLGLEQLNHDEILDIIPCKYRINMVYYIRYRILQNYSVRNIKPLAALTLFIHNLRTHRSYSYRDWHRNKSRGIWALDTLWLMSMSRLYRSVAQTPNSQESFVGCTSIPMNEND
jgi:hypothetical protein